MQHWSVGFRSPTPFQPPIRDTQAPDDPPDGLTEEHLRRMLRSCSGRTSEDRRDVAIVRLLLDTGTRRAELAALTVNDIH